MKDGRFLRTESKMKRECLKKESFERFPRTIEDLSMSEDKEGTWLAGTQEIAMCNEALMQSILYRMGMNPNQVTFPEETG